MSATEVIIQFVGLCLFSAAVPNDPGVHAILPKITTPHIHAQQGVTQVTQNGVQAAPSPTLDENRVEQHVAMLVFPDDIVVDDSEWKTKPVWDPTGVLKGYKQIRLYGEHVTFLADGLNPAPAVPANMPRFSCPRIADVAAPALTPGYQFPYDEAAAVVDIPEGTLTACNPGGTRVDTKLKLQTSGRLTVVGMKRGVAHSLVLRTDDNPRIYLLNVPDNPPKSHIEPTGTASHYLAYYAMLGKGPNNTCGGAPEPAGGLKVTESCAGNDVALAQLLYNVAGLTGDGPQIVHGVETMPISNTECSNSAWP